MHVCLHLQYMYVQQTLKLLYNTSIHYHYTKIKYVVDKVFGTLNDFREIDQTFNLLTSPPPQSMEVVFLYVFFQNLPYIP